MYSAEVLVLKLRSSCRFILLLMAVFALPELCPVLPAHCSRFCCARLAQRCMLQDAQQQRQLCQVDCCVHGASPSVTVSQRSVCMHGCDCAMQGAMVQDMFSILDVQHRFLPTYGLSKAGTKLPALQAQRARIALSRTSDAAAKARVDDELHNRGGFIPLMGHFPVMRFAAAGSSSGGAAARESVQEAAADTSEDDDAEQPAAGPELQQVGASGVQAAAGPPSEAAAAAVATSSSHSASGVHFTDSDKRLFVYMQQWWQKHRAAGKRRKKRLKTAAAVAEPAVMQGDEHATA